MFNKKVIFALIQYPEFTEFFQESENFLKAFSERFKNITVVKKPEKGSFFTTLDIEIKWEDDDIGYNLKMNPSRIVLEKVVDEITLEQMELFLDGLMNLWDFVKNLTGVRHVNKVGLVAAYHSNNMDGVNFLKEQFLTNHNLDYFDMKLFTPKENRIHENFINTRIIPNIIIKTVMPNDEFKEVFIRFDMATTPRSTGIIKEESKLRQNFDFLSELLFEYKENNINENIEG